MPRDELIERLDEGRGADEELGLAALRTLRHPSLVDKAKAAWLLHETAGPGLCLALVREMLPGMTTIAVHNPDKGEEFSIFRSEGKFLNPIGVGQHPELPRAILMALLRALETSDGK